MKTKARPVDTTDTLTLQKRMYERRMRLLKQRDGLSEKEIADEANDPDFFRKGEDKGLAASVE